MSTVRRIKLKPRRRVRFVPIARVKKILGGYAGFLTLDDAATFLDVSARTLRRWRQQGLGPTAIEHPVVGILYSELELLALLFSGSESDSRCPTSEPIKFEGFEITLVRGQLPASLIGDLVIERNSK